MMWDLRDCFQMNVQKKSRRDPGGLEDRPDKRRLDFLFNSPVESHVGGPFPVPRS